MKPGEHRLLTAAVLLFSILLHVWFVWDIPPHYDELSAIFRAGARSWQEHLQSGVYPDGHPPAVQTFLWLWIKWFGETTGLLHLLFSIFSALSVWFIYRAARLLADQEAAILATLLYGLSYLPHVWGYQIRPYAPGMAISSALIWFWADRISGKPWKMVHIGLFGLLAAAAALVHYFAALLAATLWIYGLLRAGQNRRYWIYSGLLAFLLFLPGIPVFLHQLGHGGLDWLGKPAPEFIPRHIYLLFNRQWIIPVFVAFLILWGLLKGIRPDFRRAAHLLLLFLLPAVIGFVWSYLSKPVLQDSVLLFSAPFLFIAVAIMINQVLDIRFTVLLFSIAMLTGLYHSQVFTLGRKDGYHEQAQMIRKMDKQLGMYLTQVVDGPVDVLRYHLGPEPIQGNIRFTGTDSTRLTPARLWHLIRQNNQAPQTLRIAVNAGSEPFIIPLTEHWTGQLQNRQSWIGTEYLQPGKGHQPVSYKKDILPEKGTDIPLAGLHPGPYDVVVLHLSDSSLNDSTELIAVLRNGSRQIDWRSSRKLHFRGTGDGSMFLFIKLADIPGISKQTILHIRAEVAGRSLKTSFGLRLSKGNPYLYGPQWP